MKLSERQFELRQNAREMAKLSQIAYGEMLGGIEWDWFTTLTFKADIVSERAGDRAWGFWWHNLVDDCLLKGMERPYYIRGAEYQDRGTLHFHSLIGGVGDTRRLLYKDIWEQYGYARIYKYLVNRGANYYLGKYITKGQGDIRLSKNLQRQLKANNE